MEFDLVKTTLSTIASVIGVLLVFAALVLYAINNVTDSSGGKGQGAMITCIVGAAAAFAATIVANLVPDPSESLG